jgi:hypothetical protein
VPDNVTLPGAGEVVATDEIAGRQFQRVKVTLGADGVDGGDVSAGNPLPVSLGDGRAASAVTSNVASSATTVTVLAENANRRGATIWNDSTAILYLRFGTFGASATNATVKLVADAYFEVPFGYTGAIQGIWSAVNGAARVTALT